MTPTAYYWISMAYASIALLTIISLILKAYGGYCRKKQRCNAYSCSTESIETSCSSKPMDYVLHILHVPPYLIAAYWYYNAYKDA